MILLFDVDGVLIENRAYRAGIQKTVDYFCGRLGLKVEPPSDAEIDVFEAESITVEWDTCGIVAAALVLARLRAEAARPDGPAALAALNGDVWQALEALPRRKPPLAVPVDYAGLARRAGAASRASGLLPGRAMLAALLDDVGRESALPQPATADLLEHLLGDVYAIDRAPAMQVFQNYALGDKRYAHDYGLPPPVQCEALLEQLDRPLLLPRWRDEVLRRRAAGGLHAAIYTARPSLPPAEAGAPEHGYTPEGEIGRDMAGLNGVTMMGLGKLDWWARRVGLAGSNLVKPSPVHCMAAVAAARTGLELEPVKAALAVARGDHLRFPLTACAGEAVHVFEDSPSSLGAVARAVELLNRQGLGVSLRRYGIAPAGSPKQATLAEAADGVYVDVNAALEACLGGR
jgi:hypothetical protein